MNTADSRQTKAQLIAELTMLRTRLDKLGQRPGGNKRKNHLLRLFIDSMPHFGFAIDGRGCFRQVLTGEKNVAARVLEGQLIREVLPADDAKVLQDAVRKTLKTGESQSFEFIMTVLAGRRWFEVHTAVIQSGNADGKLAVCLFQDITNLKLAEGVLRYAKVELVQKDQELRAAERRRTVVLDAVPHGIAEIDSNGVVTYGNPAYHAMLGIPDKELIGTSIFDRAETTKARDFLKSHFPRLVTEQPPPAPYFTTTRAGNGRARQLQVDWDYKRNAEGELLGFIAVLTDITQLKEAEQELRRSRDQLRLMTDNLPALITYMDAGQRFSFVNRCAEQWYGRPAGEIIGCKVKDVIGPRAMKKLRPRIRAALGGKTMNFADSVEYPDGKTRAVDITYVPDIAEDGAVRGYFGLVVDVTERRLAEEKLKESRELLQTVIDTVPHAIFAKDRQGKFRLANRAFADMHGLEPKALIGFPAEDLPNATGEQKVQLVALDERVWRTGKAVDAAEVAITPAGGKTVIHHVRKLPIRDGRGKMTGLVGISEDITERRMAEEALKRSESIMARAQEVAQIGGLEWDIASGRQIWSDEVFRILGHKPQAFEPDANMFADTLHPEDKKSVLVAMNDAVRHGKPFDVTCRIVRPDGVERIVHGLGEVSRDEAGEPLQMIGTVHDITERMRAEEALVKSEQRATKAEMRLLDAIESLPEGIIVYDDDERFVLCNSRYRDFYPQIAELLEPGTKLEVIARAAFERDAVIQAIGNVEEWTELWLREHRSGQETHEQQLSDGRWLLCNSRKTGGGDTVGVRTEITQLKQKEMELQASQRLLQTVFDSNPHAIFVRDREGRYLMVNETLAERYGLGPKEFEGRHLRDIVSGMSVDREWRTYLQSDQDVIRTGRRISLPDRTLDFPNGERRTVHTIKSPLRDEAGEVVGVVGVTEDITERKRTERELQASQRLLQTVFDSNPHAIYVRDREGRYIMVNQTMAERYNMAAEDFVGKHVSEVLSHVQTDWEAFLQTDQYVVNTGKRLTLQNRLHKLKDGSHRIIHAVKSPLRDEAGEVSGVVGVSEDVTERLRTERELQASQRLLQTVFDSISHWIFVKDKESRYLKVNRAFAESYGLLPGDFVGVHTMDIRTGTEDELRRFVETDEQVMKEDRPLVLSEYAATLPDGGLRISNMTKTPLRDEEGNVAGLVGVAEDVTESKSMQEQLRQSQKMEAMGTLAGGIAHDLNNILQPILGFTGVMLQTTDPKSENHDYLSRVFESAFRAKDLVSQILLFSRPRKSKKEPCDLKSIAVEVARFLRSSLPATIVIRENYEAKLSRVNGDHSQLHQIILNLGINAGQAMPDGGQLELELEDVHLRDLDTVVGNSLSGKYVRLAVSDSGVGMDDKTRARIFDPFFTTRTIGTGSGLGLATVFGIVRNQDGGIVVTSSPGKGSRFEVYLPAVLRAGRQSTAEDAPPATGSEHILVVDDEEMICEVARITLESLGYRVTAVRSGTRALELFEMNPRQFDLVITDQIMPELTGDRLAVELKKINPKVPIILCTGFSETISVETAKSVGIGRILLKPLTAEELGREVRLAMEGERSGPVE